MGFVKQDEPHHTEPIGLTDGGHNILSCGDCLKKLADVWVIQPETSLKAKYWANCPYCGGKSYKVELKGMVCFGGIAMENKDSEYVDDKKMLTVVDRPEWGNGEVQLVVVKARN